VGRSEADRSAGLIKEEYETQAGRTEAPTARSPVAGTVDAVKPLHVPWPSSMNHTYLDRLTVSVDHGHINGPITEGRLPQAMSADMHPCSTGGTFRWLGSCAAARAVLTKVLPDVASDI
jgi:hypothetical protein